MNQQNHNLLCDDLIPYLLDPDHIHQNQIEHHIQSCPVCQKNKVEFEEIMAMLAQSVPLKEAPADWKDDILNEVWAHEDDSLYKTKPSLRPNWFLRIKNQFTPLSAAVIGFLLAVLTFTVAEYVQLNTENKVLQHNMTLALQHTDKANGAGGRVLIMEQNGMIELYVMTEDLPPLVDNQVYQVWLIKNGKRDNAGIFRVNENGEGLLRYVMDSKNFTYDSIGITLEPDGQGTQPRGEKVLGTELNTSIDKEA